MSKQISYQSLPPTLRASVFDAVFFFIMFGAGESYLAAYGVHLGLSPFHIGLVTALPLFLGSLSQLLGVKFMEACWRRRSVIVYGVILQSFSWIIIAFVPWIFESPETRGWAVILAAVSYSICGQIIVPVWTSLMGDLVPEKSRGAFFGMRNKIAVSFLVLSFLGAGYLLKLSQAGHFERQAFTAIFLVALFARLLSGFFLSKHEDPDYSFNDGDKFSFLDFLKRAPRSNFARFTIFHGSFNMALMIAGPYFIIYMLRELHLSYWEYTWIAATWIATNFLMMQYWGKFADNFGNKKVLEMCAWGLCAVPLLWICSSNLFYLIGLQFVAGIFTAGLQLSVVNFLLDAVTPGKRGRCTAYLWVINASCVILGTLLGSALLSFFQSDHSIGLRIFLSPYWNLFLVSSLSRVLVSLFMLPCFHEVRPVEHWSYQERAFRFGKIQPFVAPGLNLAVGVYRNRLLAPTKNLRRKLAYLRKKETQKNKL